jgi:lipopolysaccharide/colanic/teichoic acid biosynthesis glycosyltransferase
LPHDDFLAQLRREKRRAERTSAPLSVVVYHMEAASYQQFDQLLDGLHQLKRETDVLGHIDDGVVAVLCPDTASDGAKAFVRKIESHTEGLPATSVCATYPDHLFDQLAEANQVGPELPPSMLADAPGAGRGEYALKRPIDVLLAAIALCLLSPLMILVALAVKLTSRGPVIFKQTRIGKDAVPFSFYKFRSMVVDGNDSIHRDFVAQHITSDLNTVDGDAEAPVFKMQADPRVTPVGRFIRKTSIDELPQLFNVLKGEMSLVGPRPPIPYEIASYQAWHLRRIQTVRPGITGLWQVEGRSRVSFNEMVRMDIRYICNRSLATDLKILLKTVLVVLRCEGAA